MRKTKGLARGQSIKKNTHILIRVDLTGSGLEVTARADLPQAASDAAFLRRSTAPDKSASTVPIGGFGHMTP